MSNIFIIKKNFNKNEKFEFIERKGVGHPDTLADLLAEYLSNKYSRYTLEKFGVVLHHNFDKVGLLGGASFVTFGKGYLTKPIKVLINGRASISCGLVDIPVKKLIEQWVKEFFKNRLYKLDPDKHLKIVFNLSSQSSPGKTYEKESKNSVRKFWFEPRTINDLPEIKQLVSNDTSIGVGYAPRSVLEEMVLDIEKTLNSEKYRKKRPWTGFDIKIMAFREGFNVKMTICIPQIADRVKSIEEYKQNIEIADRDIKNIICKYKKKVKNFELNINTRDKFDCSEVYLTAIGSSIESGDEGLVGRGNRINQLISINKPMSMEGACGKNPVYHIGKVYYLFALKLANKIYKKFGIKNEVYLASQSGRDLLDPWISVVAVPHNFSKVAEVNKFLLKEFKTIPKMTELIIKGKDNLA